MNGQTLSCSEKQNTIDEFAEKNHIYSPLSPFSFDLRGYKKFLTENNIPVLNVTEEMATKFIF